MRTGSTTGDGDLELVSGGDARCHPRYRHPAMGSPGGETQTEPEWWSRRLQLGSVVAASPPCGMVSRRFVGVKVVLLAGARRLHLDPAAPPERAAAMG